LSNLAVGVVVFSYDGWMHGDTAMYLVQAHAALSQCERVGRVEFWQECGYPVDRMRNAALKKARDMGLHYVLYLDNDMHPDCEVGQHPKAEPFLPGALEFAVAQDRPCIVAAPYCGPPPLGTVYVSEWRENAAPVVEPASGLVRAAVRRQESAEYWEERRAAALPTGVMLIDTRIGDILPYPWFQYEYKDSPVNTELLLTEDSVFTRNLDLAGVPMWCRWQSWAGHHKDIKMVRPPVVDASVVPAAVREAVLRQSSR